MWIWVFVSFSVLAVWRTFLVFFPASALVCFFFIKSFWTALPADVADEGMCVYSEIQKKKCCLYIPGLNHLHNLSKTGTWTCVHLIISFLSFPKVWEYFCFGERWGFVVTADCFGEWCLVQIRGWAWTWKIKLHKGCTWGREEEEQGRSR